MSATPQTSGCAARAGPYERSPPLAERPSAPRQAGRSPICCSLLEHHPVYTKGRRTEPAELRMGEDWYRMQGIEVTETDRGGRVTYHGPGQLVAYPIVDLAPTATTSAPTSRLERVMIAALGDYGVAGPGLRGPDRRLDRRRAADPAGAPGPQGTPVGAAALPGARRARSARSASTSAAAITTHGLAINVNNDLQPFEWIMPCGIDHVRMTSVSRELGAEQDLDAFSATPARPPRRGAKPPAASCARWTTSERTPLE